MPTACSRNSKQSKKTCATPFKTRSANRQGRSSALADPVLKFPPDQKGNPPSVAPKAEGKPRRRRALAFTRRFRRMFLLVVVPVVALVAGLIFYLNGGRYVT